MLNFKKFQNYSNSKNFKIVKFQKTTKKIFRQKQFFHVKFLSFQKFSFPLNFPQKFYKTVHNIYDKIFNQNSQKENILIA